MVKLDQTCHNHFQPTEELFVEEAWREWGGGGQTDTRGRYEVEKKNIIVVMIPDDGQCIRLSVCVNFFF